MLLEFFAAHWTLRANHPLLGSHLYSTVEAEAYLAFWAMVIAAVNDRSASVTWLGQTRVRQVNMAHGLFFLKLS